MKPAPAVSSSAHKKASFKKQNRSSRKRSTNAADETHQRKRRTTHRRRESDSSGFSQGKANKTSFIMNQAVPINRNGNMVSSFLAAQNYMRTGRLPDKSVDHLGHVEESDTQIMLHYVG